MHVPKILEQPITIIKTSKMLTLYTKKQFLDLVDFLYQSPYFLNNHNWWHLFFTGFPSTKHWRHHFITCQLPPTLEALPDFGPPNGPKNFFQLLTTTSPAQLHMKDWCWVFCVVFCGDMLFVIFVGWGESGWSQQFHLNFGKFYILGLYPFM